LTSLFYACSMNIEPGLRLLTTPEVAELLGVREETLILWRCRRRYPLPFFKIGRLVRYRRADVLNFIEANRHPGTEAKA